MSYGMTWLAGFLMGGATAFIVLAVPFRKHYYELKLKYEEERGRRLEAEGSNPTHGNPKARINHEWGDPMDFLDIEVKPWQPEEHIVGDIIDLTAIEDVPDA